MNTCPICSSSDVRLFLTRDRVPVHQNLLFIDRQTACHIARGELRIFVCQNCGFVFNAAFDPGKLSYGESYENNQACSPIFRQHLDALADYLLTECGIENANIVEVGCGQGGFLRHLIRPNNGNCGYGFDPSYRGPPSEDGGRIQYQTCYYDASCTHIKADVVICRHVIEHVADPISLLRSVRAALALSPRARVFFETPCVDWILRNQVIWDFFYEHCSLFTSASLVSGFRRAGFRVLDVRHIFNDQYLFLEAVPGDEGGATGVDSGKTPAMAKAYELAEAGIIRDWSKRVEKLRAHGPVAVWGAGAKGVTFAGLVDPDCIKLEAIVDLNPLKQGHFVAGTGHTIIAPERLGPLKVKNAILMNPNYREENAALLNIMGLSVGLHS